MLKINPLRTTRLQYFPLLEIQRASLLSISKIDSLPGSVGLLLKCCDTLAHRLIIVLLQYFQRDDAEMDLPSLSDLISHPVVGTDVDDLAAKDGIFLYQQTILLIQHLQESI
jgi:hypothetical protein